MNETSQDSTTGFGFEQRLLGELRLLVSEGALRRRDEKRRQARFTRRPALAFFAALFLLIVIGATVSIAADRSFFVSSEKRSIIDKLAHGQHIGPEVASAGPWKLFATPSTHPGGWINLELSSADERTIGGIKANNPLAVSVVSGGSTALLYGHVDPDRVAMLKLKIGDSERRVLLSSSGYFIESLEPSDVSMITQRDARLVALSSKGAMVKTRRFSIVDELAPGQHVGPEVASVGPWKLFATPSAHRGWINLELSLADMAIGQQHIKANIPLSVSSVSSNSKGSALLGRVNPDRVAMLKLEIGDSERSVLLSPSGYFIELLEPSDVSTIAQGNARLVALSKNGDVVKTYRLPEL